MELKTVQEICKAIGEGKELQWKRKWRASHIWETIDTLTSHTNCVFIDISNRDYRVKPSVARYRRYFAKLNNNLHVWTVNYDTSSTNLRYLENNTSFIKWIDTDWQEVEI